MIYVSTTQIMKQLPSYDTVLEHLIKSNNNYFTHTIFHLKEKWKITVNDKPLPNYSPPIIKTLAWQYSSYFWVCGWNPKV